MCLKSGKPMLISSRTSVDKRNFTLRNVFFVVREPKWLLFRSKSLLYTVCFWLILQQRFPVSSCRFSKSFCRVFFWFFWLNSPRASLFRAQSSTYKVINCNLSVLSDLRFSFLNQRYCYERYSDLALLVCSITFSDQRVG